MWVIIFDIVFYMWLGRVVVGAVWAMAKLRATFYDAGHWNWKDAFIAGPAFWIGWATGTGLQYIVIRARAKFRERAIAKANFMHGTKAAAEEIVAPVEDVQE